jgi:hypothetical protein
MQQTEIPKKKLVKPEKNKNLSTLEIYWRLKELKFSFYEQDEFDDFYKYIEYTTNIKTKRNKKFEKAIEMIIEDEREINSEVSEEQK